MYAIDWPYAPQQKRLAGRRDAGGSGDHSRGRRNFLRQSAGVLLGSLWGAAGWSRSALAVRTASSHAPPELSIDWADDMLTVSGDHIPSGSVEINYLEAYCRPDAHITDWTEHTVIAHETRRVAEGANRGYLKLRCKLADGVEVDHTITTQRGAVDFMVTARNPTSRPSQVHWAQPCIRVGTFTGTGPDVTGDKYAYLPKSFVFLDGTLATMPTKDWATEARYTPGQVWRAPGVKPADVNPRPLNPHLPSNGLIGCFSVDDRWILATAWHPYHELFQGVIRCLHSDFRIGGLKAGQTKHIRGTLYILPNDVQALLERYYRDFPEHRTLHDVR